MSQWIEVFYKVFFFFFFLSFSLSLIRSIMEMCWKAHQTWTPMRAWPRPSPLLPGSARPWRKCTMRSATGQCCCFEQCGSSGGLPLAEPQVSSSTGTMAVAWWCPSPWRVAGSWTWAVEAAETFTCSVSWWGRRVMSLALTWQRPRCGALPWRAVRVLSMDHLAPKITCFMSSSTAGSR